MKFAKWGNSLAVRIPSEVAERLGFRAGDEAEFTITRDKKLQIGRDRRREKALKRLQKLRFTVPADYKFDRDEIYDN
jgi:antitoxin MazE